MYHSLSYRGSIWVIQKPKIQFSDTTTISMEDTSPISPFFPTENQFQNLDSMWGHFHITCQYKNTWCNNQTFNKDVSTKFHPPENGQIQDSKNFHGIQERTNRSSDEKDMAVQSWRHKGVQGLRNFEPSHSTACQRAPWQLQYKPF